MSSIFIQCSASLKGMALIEWNAEFQIGIKSVDDQHKVLVDLLNALHQAEQNIANGHPEVKKLIIPIVNGLVRYVEIHFAFEEKLMRESRYSGYLEHKRSHERMVKLVHDYADRYTQGKASLEELKTLMFSWVTNHILHSDKQFGESVNRANRKDSSTS